MTPKLSSLTPTDKIRLAAELDGWKNYNGNFLPPNLHPLANIHSKHRLPLYATSYDAIIPLIQKQVSSYPSCCHYIRALEYIRYDGEPLVRDWDSIWEFSYSDAFEIILDATPTQLLDALLVATGKAEL